MANLNKQQVWDAINNAPPGMNSQEVLDGLVAQGHQLEGYTPHVPEGQRIPIGSNATGEFSGNTGIEEEPIARGINAMASGYGTVAGVRGLVNLPETLTSMGGAIKNAVIGIKSAPMDAEALAQGKQQLGQIMADRAKKVEDLVGGFNNDQANGTLIQQAIGKASNTARQAASEAFESLKTNAPDSATVPMNLMSEIHNQSLDLSQLPKNFQTGEIANYIKSLSGNLGQDSENVLSLKQMMAARQELSQIARANSGIQGLAGQTTNNGRTAYNLIDAIDKDIQANAQLNAPEFAKDYKAAREGWKTFKNTFSNDAIEKIMAADPSDVAHIAFNSPENLNAVQTAGGDIATNAVRNSTTQQIINKLTSSSIRNPQSILERAIATKPDEFQNLYSSSHIDALRDYTGARQALMSLPGEIPTTASDPMQKALALTGRFLPAGLASGAGFELAKWLAKSGK